MSLTISFFFNDTATTEIYTLSLHDALPIYGPCPGAQSPDTAGLPRPPLSGPRSRATAWGPPRTDRKSTRLNSSHVEISYAVFCLKKKKKKKSTRQFTERMIYPLTAAMLVQ